ncbi:Pr6Pr family membrane protein [Gordonia sp. i37]|uniref:Pr6Pr family membrane protein n=1 Tax=Gordonia sp. i37 TaxID=1961707 RepID=UPI0009AECCF9|nr:Pr6Pr family membrane protein [Gordonia sp. i37]OPX13874.1 hypothetical protein B1964_17990 [Gordonia sp. i37]
MSEFPVLSRIDERLWWIRLLRLGFAALGVAALILLPIRQADVAGFTLGNYLSYFTVLSNIAAVCVLTIGAVFAPESVVWQWVRGAATTCMAITGIVYALLLSGIDVNLNIEWINSALHRVLPLVLLVDWIVVRPRRLPAWSWWSWLAIPLVYGVYTLTRGTVVDWYPYPFIDPRAQGYLSMTMSMIVIVFGMAGLAFAVSWLGTRLPWRTAESTG